MKCQCSLSATFLPSSVKSRPRKTCFVFRRMTASRPVIIETCPSAQCSTRSPPVSPHLSCLVLRVCDQATWERGGGCVFFTVNTRSIDGIDARFSKVIQVPFGRFDAWLVHARHQLSRWCPVTVFSQMARRSTLTLSWSQGEKRCRTSLGPCWWRAARPIRRRGVSHHVTASPIAIYFTIGQMKRLILTICSLMCFSLSLLLLLTRLFHSLTPGYKLLAQA